MAIAKSFSEVFRRLTGFDPMPWQEALYERFVSDRVDNIPASCNLPTGLGKTSVIAIWLAALAKRPERIPRRLVYVVNRRTVVDQTTDEAEKLQRNAELANVPEPVISTLRGQFADNREWSADPSRPAVVCGTVDMIGSRLLFSGYGVGFRGKPLQAGFLGQDALLVHDEAHLEPAFQTLIESIESEQTRCREFGKLCVMELTATSRSGREAFTLTDDDQKNDTVKNRIRAKKSIHLHASNDEKKLGDDIGDLAVKLHRESGQAIVVFVRKVEDVDKVAKKLPKGTFEQLTGTLRGLERDALVKKPVFQRFLAPTNRDMDVPAGDGTVYLVCTSAGEVGIDISADHMICDLSTFESMAQRFGRVNRYGDPVQHVARIDVVHPSTFGKADKKTGKLIVNKVEKRRQKTLDLLRTLPTTGDKQYDASPLALSELDAEQRIAAFAPIPEILPVTDILFDAWALTSIRSYLPGRPPVEPYLHGVADWQQPETHVAWREEVGAISADMFIEYPPRDLLELYPLKPHELLRDQSKRVFKELQSLAKHFGDRPIWLVDEYGVVDATQTLSSVTEWDESLISGNTVLLPHDIGGLNGQGMLDGSVLSAKQDSLLLYQRMNDVADVLLDENSSPFRIRVENRDDAAAAGMRRVHSIKWPDAEDDESDAEPRKWFWYEKPISTENLRHALRPVLLDVHTKDVEDAVDAILKGLSLEHWIADALRLAAKWHDIGKCRERWQVCIGRPDKWKESWFAKSGRLWRARRDGNYRHEFGSLLDVMQLDEFKQLDARTQDLVLHLMASHHGMARPHFDECQTIDSNHKWEAASAISIESARRFARLQRTFGHWGLAYLESILRAADWYASATPSECFEEAAP